MNIIWLKIRTNWDVLIAERNTIDITAILRNENIMQILNYGLLEACKRHIPRKTILFLTNDQPCFDESCRRAHHHKQTLLNIWGHNRSHENYQNFSEARSEGNKTYYEAKIRYKKLKAQLQITQDHLWWIKLVISFRFIYFNTSAIVR